MSITNIPISQKTQLNMPTTQGLLDSFHPIGFMGYRLDKPSGCYILGNGYRMYNPVMRAFYSPDSESPFGRGGISRYQYCYFDPINRADPSGHVSGQAVGGVILGILGMITGIILAVPTGGSSLILAAGAGVMGAAAAVTGAAAVGMGIASFAYTGLGDEEKAKLFGNISVGLGGLSYGIASVGGGVFAAHMNNHAIGFALGGGGVQIGGAVGVFSGVGIGNQDVVFYSSLVISIGAGISSVGTGPATLGRFSSRIASNITKKHSTAFRHPNVMKNQMANAARNSKAPTYNEVTGTIWSQMPSPKWGV
jgi:RHS repeat-associated protein